MGFFRYLAVFGSAVAPARLFIHAAVLVEPNRSRKIEFPSDLHSKVIERLKVYPGLLQARYPSWGAKVRDVSNLGARRGQVSAVRADHSESIRL